MNMFVHKLMNRESYKNRVDLNSLNLAFTGNDLISTTHDSRSISKLQCIQEFVEQIDQMRERQRSEDYKMTEDTQSNFRNAAEFFEHLGQNKLQEAIDNMESLQSINKLRCERKPMFGKNLIKLLTITRDQRNDTNCLQECMRPLQERFTSCKGIIENYAVLTPNAVTLDSRKLAVGSTMKARSMKMYETPY